ncbi:MAG: AAA family ATPase [Oscillospiraceae bacterium]|nr:AAA family ATPase [Oscillospiraceae bacterium]
MRTGIILCGGNGSGKSTIGKELAESLNYKLMDVEDYYFPKKDSDFKYDYPIPKNEVIELLLKDMKENEKFVMTSVTGNYGDEITSQYTFVVIIDVPKDIRLERVRKRSFEKFGDRILLGGDLHEKEKKFFDMVASRPDDIIETWVNTLNCPVVRIDGTKPVSYNVKLIISKLLNK